jgi:oligopeptide transport system substrate-binding protein
LYGGNSKVLRGGENAVNYQNPEFDKLFEQMRNMDNSPERMTIIEKMQAMIQRDAPWAFGYHPKDFALYHSWYKNIKPNQMVNNRLKYLRINAAKRAEKQREWNQPVFWPLAVVLGIVGLAVFPAVKAYRQRLRRRVK